MKKILPVLFLFTSTWSFGQWNDQTSNSSNDLNDVFFIDNNTGWSVGRNGALVNTTNGGSTWTAQNSSTNYDLNDIFMVNSTTGYAVGEHGTVIKYTGSATWTTLTTGTTLDLFGVHFINASTGWISGDYGRIMMTTDGGASWITQVNNSTYTNLFNDIFMLNANEGWAVGTTGKILKYNGTNWATVTSGVTTELLGCYFNGSGDGFAVGKSSVILHWNGTNWTTHNSGLTSYNIHNVHMLSSSLAYAATSDGFGGTGIILKYNGSTWSKDYEYSGIFTEIFYGVHFPSSSKGYVVGAGGQIKTTGNGGTSGISDIDNASIKEVFPNPFNHIIRISFSLKESGSISIVLNDITGQKIKTIANNKFNAGNHIVEIDGTVLPAGIYFYTLISDQNTVSGKLVKE